jgi:hypothetical protein
MISKSIDQCEEYLEINQISIVLNYQTLQEKFLTTVLLIIPEEIYFSLLDFDQSKSNLRMQKEWWSCSV